MPYPAFVQADELENAYLASVPGTIAKQFSGDPQTRRTSNRIDLPAGWEGTTGGAPGMLVEIVVLKGDVMVGDVKLGPAGYAHIPPGTFAYNCLLARRLAERGVRFTQIFHRGWDQHNVLPKDLPNQCRDIDQPTRALLTDLKQRGMLDDTLVVWGGEFGRIDSSSGKSLYRAIERGFQKWCLFCRSVQAKRPIVAASVRQPPPSHC